MDKMLIQYEPIVKKQLISLNNDFHRDDLYQVGMIGLWEAIERFDEEKGSFGAYAIKTVRGKMLTYLKKQTAQQYAIEKVKAFGTEMLSTDTPEIWMENQYDFFPWDLLSEKEIFWVTHHVFLGYSRKEIMLMTGVTASAYNGWRRQALKKLKKHYAGSLQ
ncbi:sigma-70 family RNA polymerase sigma factor [Bacillus marinisedimentorum]|uniref:sigma-70 family RNA polymerase sigma factor n=1 Tax=Bacillus marinisedimentorum TaxID=1821260 RepID=UPI0014721C0C|nr:sigma-70 family RNA polymerase sigma factor [Bacillus marinisedimentorum]